MRSLIKKCATYVQKKRRVACLSSSNPSPIKICLAQMCYHCRKHFSKAFGNLHKLHCHIGFDVFCMFNFLLIVFQAWEIHKIWGRFSAQHSLRFRINVWKWWMQNKMCITAAWQWLGFDVLANNYIMHYGPRLYGTPVCHQVVLRWHTKN